MEIKKTEKVCGGELHEVSHPSDACKCPMTFAIFLPAQAAAGPVPAVYWLSGLTCSEQNFITKAGAFKKASELGLAIICPDTSPRGIEIEGADDSWDFGSAASFYVDATEPKWTTNYNMHTYVKDELPALIESKFAVSKEKRSIMGHSMGGHGALTLFLRNPGSYASTSAFAPICNPSKCPWGEKAFTGYLGTDQATWSKYDATELVKSYDGPKSEILIDQGTGDSFYPNQLLPENFEKACKDSSYPVNVRYQEGYSHSYYFIASFVEDHLAHHAKFLC